MTVTDIQPPESAKSEQRRRAILDVAREAFLAQGFAATSMSEIAARLGGSKGTLYNYFRSKEELFAAIMIDTCQGPANAVFDHMPRVEGDLRTGLIELGCGLLKFILSPPSVAVHRVVAAEAGRFPELGRIFFETGPRMGQRKLEEYFRQVIEDGLLKPADPAIVARRFKDLILSDIHSRRIWGVLGELSAEQIHTQVIESVDICLIVFGPVGR